ncbi:hypothetical protein GQ53DRAFT_461699 [Thozetella sp. PMI_491]|nr:hypothetical protein GQ53DRAFT_461699 [Thozetella sp. PMI_491]
MAAPASKTLKDLTGKWALNKSLSDSPEPALALQGIGWLTRKAIGLASVTLNTKQYTGPPNAPADASGAPVVHIDIEQTATGNLKGTTENRCVDGTWREHSDWLFGSVRGRTIWIKAEAIEDPFLAGNWLEGDEEAAGPEGETHIMSHVESLDNGWTAVQIWGFQTVNGERRYARNLVISKGSDKVTFRMVYDWVA